MPKGVEHSKIERFLDNLAWVKIPLMPKGVEHVLNLSDLDTKRKVKIPLMPKGVEHAVYSPKTFAWAFLSEDSFDAERR